MPFVYVAISCRKITHPAHRGGDGGHKGPAPPRISSEPIAHAERRLHGVEGVVVVVDHLVEVTIAAFGPQEQAIRRVVFHAEPRVQRESAVVRDRYRQAADGAVDPVVQVRDRIADASEDVRVRPGAVAYVLDCILVDRVEVEIDVAAVDVLYLFVTLADR